MINKELTSFRRLSLLVVGVTLLAGLNNRDNENDGLKRASERFCGSVE